MNVEKQWTKIIWRLSKEDAVQYRELKGTEVNEFFNIMKANNSKNG